jgi:hypothetical protein
MEDSSMSGEKTRENFTAHKRILLGAVGGISGFWRGILLSLALHLSRNQDPPIDDFIREVYQPAVISCLLLLTAG